jgi:zinc transporter ZupT
MENTFWTALRTSLLAAFVTSLGIYTIRRFAAWGQRNTAYFMCFAAGVLIAASFLHIIPTSFAMNPQAPIWLLVGFLGLHLFNRFLTAFVCERDPNKKDYGTASGSCRCSASAFIPSSTGLSTPLPLRLVS